MRVLIACEESGEVRRAFRALGHDAWSCDLLPAADGSEFHLRGDVLKTIDPSSISRMTLGPRLYAVARWQWDLMIAFPPCTDLRVSGARWFKEKREDGRQQAAIQFVRCLMDAPIPRIAIENPIGILSTVIRKPDQIIQPWMFGHGETKATCLWLKNLPKLVPTQIVEGREARVHRMAPGPNRARDRARTLPGIAKAMAEQWSNP